MSSDRPVVPCSWLLGKPHSGGRRGKNTNSTSISGMAHSSNCPDCPSSWRTVGRPAGRWALTSAASRPHRASNAARAVSRLCECKNTVTRLKKPRKKITMASRRARISRVFMVSSKASRATPASGPTMVRNCSQMLPTTSANTPSSSQRPGSACCCHARRARHSNMPTPKAPAHSGKCASWGSSTSATAARISRVSRASRGS